MTFGNTNKYGVFVPSKGYGQLLDEKDDEIRRLREIIRTVAPTGSINALAVRKATTFEEAEIIYSDRD